MIAGHNTMMRPGQKFDYENTIFYIYNANLTFTMGQMTKDSGSSSVVFDWGDGTSTEYTSSSFTPTHTYSDSKLRFLTISNDVSGITKYHSSDAEGTLIRIISLGNKIQTLGNQCFQGAGFSNTRSFFSLVYPSVDAWRQDFWDICEDHVVELYPSSFPSYSLEALRCRSVRFVNLTSLTGVMFYSGGLYTVQNIYFSQSSIAINGNYLNDWSSFMQGWTYDSNNPDWTKYYTEKHLYFENNTCAQIQAKSNFPWNPVDTCTTYYHGTDGIIDKNGNPI